MSSGLEAIATELKRLQRDGVNRVFVEDDTMRLIAPEKDASGKTGANSPKATPSVQHADLRELIKETPMPQRKATAQTAKVPKATPLPDAPQIDLPAGDAATRLAWLREQVLACEVCQKQLSQQGKVVFGTGSPHADIFFCGEAPGADEALVGEPFIGKAGQLLTKIITAMGLSRENVYLDYILKWRPEHDKPYGNRPPTDEEMRFCLPYLEAEIEIIKPKVIVALGNTALSGLIGPDPERKMGSVRGTWTHFKEIPVMTTFPPSYLLRNGTLKTKRITWEDMLQVMEKCALEISEKQRGFFLPK
jgi:DNA polymerase